MRASRKQSGRGLDGACHTIVAITPTARVALVVTFAGLASAGNKVADLRLELESGATSLAMRFFFSFRTSPIVSQAARPEME